MSEITCELIPLYRLWVRQESDDDEYEYVFVADTIEGLIKGIIHREVKSGFDLSDCRKYFCVYDFILMPCKGSARGYHLLDIDEHSIDTCHGSNFDEMWYHCVFKGDRPQPVMERPVHNPEHTISMEDIEDTLAMESAIAEEIYLMSKTHKLRAEAEEKERAEKDTHKKEAHDVIEEWIEKTG